MTKTYNPHKQDRPHGDEPLLHILAERMLLQLIRQVCQISLFCESAPYCLSRVFMPVIPLTFCTLAIKDKRAHTHPIGGFIPAVIRGICAEEIAVKVCLRLLLQPEGSLKLPSHDKKCGCCLTQGWMRWMRSISSHRAAAKCVLVLTLQVRHSYDLSTACFSTNSALPNKC